MSELKVKHNLEDLNEEGLELVLNDVSVLQDEEDELFNPNVASQVKARANIRSRKLVIPK